MEASKFARMEIQRLFDVCTFKIRIVKNKKSTLDSCGSEAKCMDVVRSYRQQNQVDIPF